MACLLAWQATRISPSSLQIRIIPDLKTVNSVQPGLSIARVGLAYCQRPAFEYLDAVTGSTEEQAMKRESLNFRNIDDHSGAGVRARVEVVPSEKAQAAAVPRNWAWAHFS